MWLNQKGAKHCPVHGRWFAYERIHRYHCIRTNTKYCLQAIAYTISLLPMRIKTVEMLGELVRDQRKRRGWSQTRLAKQAGVSRLWIGHLERGK